MEVSPVSGPYLAMECLPLSTRTMGAATVNLVPLHPVSDLMKILDEPRIEAEAPEFGGRWVWRRREKPQTIRE